MEGGLGDDTYVVDDFSDAIVEETDIHLVNIIIGQPPQFIDIAGGVDTVRSAVDHALGYDLENLTLSEPASGAPAVIEGLGNIERNVILGNSADNVLTAHTLNGASDNRPGVLIGFLTPNDGAQERLFDRAAQLLYKNELQESDFNDSGTLIEVGPRPGDALDGGMGNDRLTGDWDHDTLIVEKATILSTATAAWT
jgi:Ca2+-binding RTX toxin-like protein